MNFSKFLGITQLFSRNRNVNRQQALELLQTSTNPRVPGVIWWTRILNAISRSFPERLFWFGFRIFRLHIRKVLKCPTERSNFALKGKNTSSNPTFFTNFVHFDHLASPFYEIHDQKVRNSNGSQKICRTRKGSAKCSRGRRLYETRKFQLDSMSKIWIGNLFSSFALP